MNMWLLIYNGGRVMHKFENEQQLLAFAYTHIDVAEDSRFLVHKTVGNGEVEFIGELDFVNQIINMQVKNALRTGKSYFMNCK